MRRDFTSKTCSMAGSSDLTVVAPLLPGLVPALDTVTYASRTKRVLRALHLGRGLAHEYDLVRVLSDAVERVGGIHSVRIALLEPNNQVMLAVTFDGAWESYVRVVWQKVARLLDLIFCNTVDYVPGWSSTYEEWGAWLRWRQAETQFLYGQPGLTAPDGVYLRMYERRHRRDATGDRQLAACAVPSAEEIADQLMLDGIDPTNLGLSTRLEGAVEAVPPAFRQGMRALAGLYRLSDLYPPGTDEGGWLLRAAHELLPEFRRLVDGDGRDFYPAGVSRAQDRFHDVLAWFRTGFGPAAPNKRLRPPPDRPLLHAPDTIQAGILEPYPDTSHGVLGLLSFDSREALSGFLAGFEPTTREQAPTPGDIVRNIAFTLEGLRLAGLSDDEVEQLPEEFVQGMEARAAVLGDLRINHPRRWRLPALNWNDGPGAADTAEDTAIARVELSAVHVAVQLRLLVGREGVPQERDAARQELWAELQRLAQVHPGVRPLSLQWMQRVRQNARPSDHFGFGDGGSDPVLEACRAGVVYPNHVHAGEALVGYETAADPPPATPPEGSIADLLRNGSFLVVRKLRQDVGVLKEAVARAADEGVDRDMLLGRMMGRWPSSHEKADQPLVDLPAEGKGSNDFDYRGDPHGLRCPLQAHIRAANPRTVHRPELGALLTDGARPPRLFRRGMSYGEPHDPKDVNSAGKERGLVFMAYNASIGEQFELVQRWLAGGNSAGGYSGAPDPVLGLPEPGRKRIFRFYDGTAVRRVHLDGSDRLHEEPRPLVRLEWGAYLFAPSTRALARLRDWRGPSARDHREAVPWDADRGERLVQSLLRIADTHEACLAWKAALEDVESVAEFDAASIWAAIRRHHGGLLRTPYGVLVASDALVGEVLKSGETWTSVKGYLPRMRESFGEIFLGRDQGDVYHREADPVLPKLQAIPADQTRSRARECTTQEIARLVAEAKAHSCSEEQARREMQLPPRKLLAWDLTLDVRELVDHLLATFCEEWFGLSEDGGFFERGGFLWGWQAGRDLPRYPGHFMAPSRYFFQPHPGPQAERTGQDHGRALLAAMQGFLAAHGDLKRDIVRAALGAPAAQEDPTYAARTLIGAIMGFVPTIDGVLRRVLAEWLRDGTFWRLRARRANCGEAAWADLLALTLRRTMQARSVPDTMWRTATADHALGDGAYRVAIARGEKVVLGLVSAGQERFEGPAPARAKEAHVEVLFGGQRTGAPPTHACPGMDAALAMMHGFLDALLGVQDERMHAGLAPLTVMFDGRTPYVAEPPPEEPAPPAERGAPEVPRLDLRTARELQSTRAAYAKHVRVTGLFDLERIDGMEELAGFLTHDTFVRTVPFWAIGDSWLWSGVVHNLIPELAQRKFRVADLLLRQANTGRKLRNMADPGQLAEVVRALRHPEEFGVDRPEVILIGGGGNDIVYPESAPRDTRLYQLLVPNATNPDRALQAGAVDEFIDKELRGYYETILDRIAAVAKVPILLHGYDHPIPDGRRNFWGPGPWLKRVFEARGITDEAVRRRAMGVLIDRLNAMAAAVAETSRKSGLLVHHVGFNGVLEKQDGYAATPDGYKLYWQDELHPTPRGFKVLAEAVVAKLAELGVKP